MNSLIKRKFSAKVVEINFSDLVKISKKNDFKAISKEITDAYGVNGLGILVIRDVLGLHDRKLKLLEQTLKITQLPKDELNKLEDQKSKFAFGWSHGKENFNGKPDLLKGSYYASLDPIITPSKDYENMNIWPSGKTLPELKSSFIGLGNQIREVSINLYGLIDSYIKNINPNYNVNMKLIIEQSTGNIGRLLHYFPRGDHILTSDESWCGWHNDHGSLTGLVSPIYFDQKNIPQESLKLEKTGLWIQERNGKYTKVTYGKNDIAFQIGETYQILSGGKLYATPHAVIVNEDIPKDIHRSTFALFMEPNFDYKIHLPQGSSFDDIKTQEIYTVPKLEHRFNKNGLTFKEFHENTFKLYYDY